MEKFSLTSKDLLLENSLVVSSLVQTLDAFEKTYYIVAKRFINYRVYIPEFSKQYPEDLPKVANIVPEIENIKQQLLTKKEDISKTNFDIKESIAKIKNFISELNEQSNKLILDSNKLQHKLDDTNNSRVSLCRKICNARKNLLIDECCSFIDKIKEITIERATLAASIKEKEGKVKTSKREVVAESLSMFLDCFFAFTIF